MIDSLRKLFVEEIKDLYHAEKQLTKALPKMAKAASSTELKNAFNEHLQQTETHVSRLEDVFDKIGKPARGKKCEAMAGLIEEAQEHIKEDMEPTVRDAALIASACRVEHYEMAGYGTARSFADLLGENDAASLLQETLDEEGEANKKLMKLAQSINREAMKA